MEAITRNPTQAPTQFPVKQRGEEVWDLFLLLSPIPHFHPILLALEEPEVEPLVLSHVLIPPVHPQFNARMFVPPMGVS